MSAKSGMAAPPRDQGPQTQFEYFQNLALGALRESKPTVITALAAATPVVVVPNEEVPEGYTVRPHSFRWKVKGATAWATTMTVLNLQTNADTPTNLAAVAIAALTANAVVKDSSANVTIAAPMYNGVGADPGKGISLAADANAGAGSDIVAVVTYSFVKNP